METMIRRHEWDDDGICIHCGLDGAEWYHWKHHTYEGKASDELTPPSCEVIRPATRGEDND